ncbi:MAG: HD domain-containing protein, partial [Thermoproteota archaeon]
MSLEHFQELIRGEIKRLEELEEPIPSDSRLTRPSATLQDHLILTAGISVAIVKDLMKRGLSPKDICGEELDEMGLLKVTELSGLIHDIGKAYGDYKLHVEHGVNWLMERARECALKDPVFSMIEGIIKRHHIRDEPATPLEMAVCLSDSYASAGDRPELFEGEQAYRANLELEKKLLGDRKAISLLMGDVDSIKGYVYESDTLSDIRGGSAILVDTEGRINEFFRSRLSEENLIYCGGGSFLALAPSSEADKIAEEIRHLYLELSHGIATITVAVSKPLGYMEFARGLPSHEEEVKGLKGTGVAEWLIKSHFGKYDRLAAKCFGEVVAKLSSELRILKESKSSAPFFPALPIQWRCQACGKRPASIEDPLKEEKICEQCWHKRDKGRKERKSKLVIEFEDWCVRHQQKVPRWELPENLDEIGERVGFIYADGNNIGNLLQRASTPAQYRHISKILTMGTRESLLEALANVCATTAQAKMPFEIVSIGGDDVVVIARSDLAWPIALRFLENFEKEGSRLSVELKEKITASASVLIADVKYPVKFMERLANSLLKDAKRTSRICEGESAITFLNLTASIAPPETSTIIE